MCICPVEYRNLLKHVNAETLFDKCDLNFVFLLEIMEDSHTRYSKRLVSNLTKLLASASEHLFYVYNTAVKCF